MRNAGTWTLAFAGGLAGFLTWLISEPFAHTAAEHGTRIGLSYFTLGSFYGWFAHYLLGALIAGFLAILMTLPRAGLGRALIGGFVAACVGGALTCGADALSDVVGIRVSQGAGDQLMPSLFAGLIVPLIWHPMVSLAIALSVALASYPTAQRMRRAFSAGLVAAIASYFARDLLNTIFQAANFAASADRTKLDLQHPQDVLVALDAWKPWAIDRLGSHVVMGLIIGLAMGFAESRSRAAWLRHEAGRNEGRDYGLYMGQNRVGSAEGLEVALRGDAAVAPVHAVLQPHQGHWLVTDVSGQGMTVNGFPAPNAYLNEGDVVQVGSSTLRFHLDHRRRRRVKDQPLPVPLPVVAPAPVVEARPVTVDHRLVDPFGQVYSLAAGQTILGRGADAQIRLDYDNAVSRRHALLTLVPTGPILRPISTNSATQVNGQTIDTDTALRDGDQIKVGGTVLTYRG